VRYRLTIRTEWTKTEVALRALIAAATSYAVSRSIFGDRITAALVYAIFIAAFLMVLAYVIQKKHGAK
jgi:hypothetical protein